MKVSGQRPKVVVTMMMTGVAIGAHTARNASRRLEETTRRITMRMMLLLDNGDVATQDLRYHHPLVDAGGAATILLFHHDLHLR
jgi:hypothetical protein